MSTLSATYESVPRYRRLPKAVLRAQLQSAALLILAEGQTVSTQRLRECGVRGGTAQLIALREELGATGELPPEAAARVYAPPKHPPGKASIVHRVHGPSGPSNAPEGLPRTKDHGPEGRRRRWSRRLVQEYNSAVRNVFGQARAREIGAC
ncbi:MAG: hypothetical protein ACXWPK_00170 [Isosphaeraceae bacterium]